MTHPKPKPELKKDNQTSAIVKNVNSHNFDFPPLTPETGLSDKRKSGYSNAMPGDDDAIRHAAPSTRKYRLLAYYANY